MNEYVINCAGEKVPVSGKLFENRCSMGNLEDYLAANQQYVIPETQDWLDIPRISIVMPIYNSGKDFIKHLTSLYTQEWAQPSAVEIILYINQPVGEDLEATLESIHAAKEIISSLANNTPRVVWIYEHVTGGLPEVYQRAFTSLVQRIHTSISQRTLTPKDVMVAAIDKALSETVFAVVDDDLLFCDSSLANALEHVEAEKAIVTGQIEITAIETRHDEWGEVLSNIMNLFFLFKHEHGSATLTPRAITVKDMLHMPAVAIGTDYADQIWFAAGAANKERLLVKAQSTLEEESYPSNAKMTVELSAILATGTDNNALAIFESIKDVYDNSCENALKTHRYNASDVARLLKTIQARNHADLLSLTQEMLMRPL